ncbi:MAG: NfeD family protein [Deltaproteobacteria bacterium]|jgi:membrane protein implicated in regulation of membrane protease activity|nr:NfeD family protein [Deltaproteobacteria bacterium]MCW8892254.1 NfeD family protein [Deltaproteobacteria bacterium]MCW9049572.1 NfeD family protein [Deltaproteobacteria bacterium]
MGFEPLYWHWLVFGAVLILAELALVSFTALWFGLGAMIVAFCLFVYPEIPLAYQLLLWTFASVGFTVAWFKILKPRMKDKTLAGLSREAIIGQIGQVTKAPFEGKRGELRFPAPVVGDDTWDFICTEPVSPGDRVIVTDVVGNSLQVVKK